MSETEGEREGSPAPPPSEAAPHSCQLPQTDLPDDGSAWTCPVCGRRWRVEDVSDDPERGGPGQRLFWAVEGEPPPPKDMAPPPEFP
jgi:hypothetical protein